MNFTSPYVDLPKRLTVLENLRVFADLYGIRDARRRIDAVADDCDITGLLRRPYGELSAGQRTRVSLAKAVLNEPDVLLLDEPTASLDPDIGDRMRTYLEQYQRRTGCTMLLASHHMGEVERLCQDVIMLRAGEVVDQGSPQALLARYGRDTMEDVFLDVARGRVRRAHGRAWRRRIERLMAIVQDTGATAAVRRVLALVRRHAYLLLKSWPRMVSMAYYPTVTMVLWAFLTLYLAPTASFLQSAPGFFIGAVLLWDVLFRGQLGVSLTYVEELYARNLGNLFVSPLTLPEFIAGQLVMSVLRTLIGVGGACLFAWLLFRYSIFSMGLPLIAFFTQLLVFGWGIGLAVSGMIMRWGLGAEELAWAAIFLIAPVSGVYYPIGVLPAWLQMVAYSLPSAHVFEGMRSVLLTGVFRWDHFWAALLLDVVYLVVGALLFALAVRHARDRGALLQMGE